MNNSKKPQTLAKIGIYSLILAMIITVAIIIYATHPWRGNYANQMFTDYVYLLAFSFWSIIPYLALMILIHLFKEYKLSYYIVISGSEVIILTSLLFLIDTVFIHPNSQGAYIFLFLPIYQWLAILLLGIVVGIAFQLNKNITVG